MIFPLLHTYQNGGFKTAIRTSPWKNSQCAKIEKLFLKTYTSFELQDILRWMHTVFVQARLKKILISCIQKTRSVFLLTSGFQRDFARFGFWSWRVFHVYFSRWIFVFILGFLLTYMAKIDIPTHLFPIFLFILLICKKGYFENEFSTFC